MENIKIKKINFGSFLKLILSINMGIAIVIGIIGIVITLIKPDLVYFKLNSIQLVGIQAGLVNLIVFPLMLIILGFLFSLVFFLPFKLFVKVIGGLKIKGEIEEY